MANASPIVRNLPAGKSPVAWYRQPDLMLAAAVISTLLVMILPIPAFVMDILIATNLALSVSILLVSVYTNRPLDFSVFPTVLLFATLFRLSLNVASIRLILLHGNEGTAAAGHIIESFGRFVVGGSYVVGIVVFVLLIIINFVVITKGSGRVAEVAARFILDAMPGKQMSIDADLNAGILNEDQAKERRRKIEREADFYGAMDGSSKFVRGDAIAGILITLVNIVGGLAIGIFQKGLEVGRAAELYTLMTIGDGLVTQMPSLIISTAAGIVVTRAASGSDLSKEVASQVLFQPRAMGFTAILLFLMGILPGLPTLPFFCLGAGLVTLSVVGRRRERSSKEEQIVEERKQLDQRDSELTLPPEVDSLELQVGYGLVSLVDSEGKGDLVDRITSLRKEFARDLGIVIPKVRIKDNLELGSTDYAILIRSVTVARGELMLGHCLAMDPGGVTETLEGTQTQEPVFNLPAIWTPEKNKEKAQMSGYTVVDLSTIMATHLSEIIRKHASELVGRQELQALTEAAQKTHPKVVEELIPTLMPLGTVLKVCQNLLREQVPIRDLITILETLANHGGQTKDPDQLTEYVRAALARTITSRLTSGTSDLEVITMAGRVEETLIRGYQRTENGATINMEPGLFERLITELQRTLEFTAFTTGSPVLLCHPLIRGCFKKLVERFIPNLSVVSANEIASFAKVRSLAVVEV